MVVYIIGAGPGHPELVTIRAKKLIENSDVIIYDKLANPQLLDWAKPGCNKIYVGKREKDSRSSQEIQEHINSLLKEYGSDSKVVRLKGGDPFIFGRGGEEAQVCARSGIPFEIVPGISSCYAAPAYAGIPVSHRDFNSSFAVLTGHESDKDESAIDWEHLPENIVVLMGVRKIRETAKKLLDFGRDPATPVAAVHKGTTEEQRTERLTLEELAERGILLKPPVVFVIGPVASLHEELSWFEKKLGAAKGKKVVLTRAAEHMDESLLLFEPYGIDIVPMPLIRIVSRDFTVPEFGDYDCLVFTSLEGVKRVSEKADIKSFGGSVFAIGPKTKAHLATLGVEASMGDSYNSEGLAEHILSILPKGGRILTLRSSAATSVLKDKLSARFTVDEVPVYDIESLQPNAEKISGADAVFLVSASCARGISELDPKLLEDKILVSIGPETSRHIDISHTTASTHTIKGMIDAYIEYLWTGLP
jgi:uroporphyrinogen III methyltransferase/synthase